MVSWELKGYLTKETKAKTDKKEKTSPAVSPWNQSVRTYGEVYDRKDLKKRRVSSLEWKRMIDGNSSNDDSVDLTCVDPAGWWDERPRCGWGSRKEWGSLFQRWGAACQKIICSIQEGGLEMVITDEDRVLQGDWTETDLIRYAGWQVVRTL